MFLTSSCIILKSHENINLDKLSKDNYFTMPKNQDDEYSFYSLTFYDENKSMGEIHWTESFLYGKMNLINFIRRGKKFILFTSSIQNHKILVLVLEKLLGQNLQLEILKIPLKYKLSELKIKEVVSVESQNIFGVSLILNLEDTYSLLKIYTNGLITYSMTNNEEIINRNIDIALGIIKSTITGSEE